MICNTENYKGYTIALHYDEDAESPREWDNVFTMACWHRRYNLGDIHNDDSLIPKIRRMKYAWPLYLYDHSGITISMGAFSDPWDSGQVGWIYATVDKLRHELGRNFTPEKAKQMAEAEVAEYDKYIRGEAYFIEILKDGETIDTVGGYLGAEYAWEEGRSMVDGEIDHQEREHQEQVKAWKRKHQEQVKVWIRNHVPLEKRV